MFTARFAQGTRRLLFFLSLTQLPFPRYPVALSAVRGRVSS
jgi:hypothetical protein